MSFNPSVPLNSDPPGTFPSQNQTNMSRLQTIVGADHVFNLAAAGNDGYHNLIHMTVQAPSGALANTGRFYVKSSGGNINAFYMDDAAKEYQITPSMPIRAAVSFEGKGAIGVQTLRSSYNVASVNKTATGDYTITYTNAFPDSNYIAVITGMRETSGAQIYGFIEANATITNSISTTFLKINFSKADGSAVDCNVGNVIIMSVT